MIEVIVFFGLLFIGLVALLYFILKLPEPPKRNPDPDKYG